jgi:hypothetical protein
MKPRLDSVFSIPTCWAAPRVLFVVDSPHWGAGHYFMQTSTGDHVGTCFGPAFVARFGNTSRTYYVS